MKAKIIYKNKWCKLMSIGTTYILKSLSNKYNDQYYSTLSDAYRAIGITKDLK